MGAGVGGGSPIGGVGGSRSGWKFRGSLGAVGIHCSDHRAHPFSKRNFHMKVSSPPRPHPPSFVSLHLLRTRSEGGARRLRFGRWVSDGEVPAISVHWTLGPKWGCARGKRGEAEASAGEAAWCRHDLPDPLSLGRSALGEPPNTGAAAMTALVFVYKLLSFFHVTGSRIVEHASLPPPHPTEPGGQNE